MWTGIRAYLYCSRVCYTRSFVYTDRLLRVCTVESVYEDRPFRQGICVKDREDRISSYMRVNGHGYTSSCRDTKGCGLRYEMVSALLSSCAQR